MTRLWGMIVVDPDMPRPRLNRVLGRFPQQSNLEIELGVWTFPVPKRAFLQESGQYLWT